MVTMFIDTLPSPYYDRVVGNVASNFANLVVVGERIELGIRRGKFAQTSNNTSFAKKPTSERKKGWINAVLVEPAKVSTSSYSTWIQVSSHTSSAIHPTVPNTSRRWDRYQHKADIAKHEKATQAFSLLLEQKLIEVVPLKPLEPPYPRSYDPNARLKHKLQDLLDDGLLGFEDKGPNVHNNPLPAHGVTTINVISHEDGRAESTDRRKDREPGHAIGSANMVEERSYLHQLGENGTTTIAYIEGNDNPRPKPLIIQYNLAPKPRVPTRLVYNNNIRPWRHPQIIKETAAPDITNIARTGGMTRSGRIFAPKSLRNKDPPPAKKEKIVETPKRIVTEEEAHEFLKIIRHSGYKILDQLHKMPARISLLSLLINLESHRELLLKILNDAHLPQDITPAKFGGIINNITTSCHLSFSEEEVPVEGQKP
ncbi:hypothetical protein CR513_16326, partial [Mucuna pruriens]